MKRFILNKRQIIEDLKYDFDIDFSENRLNKILEIISNTYTKNGKSENKLITIKGILLESIDIGEEYYKESVIGYALSTIIWGIVTDDVLQLSDELEHIFNDKVSDKYELIDLKILFNRSRKCFYSMNEEEELFL